VCPVVLRLDRDDFLPLGFRECVVERQLWRREEHADPGFVKRRRRDREVAEGDDVEIREPEGRRVPEDAPASGAVPWNVCQHLGDV
jgi:hypothetical protein